MRLFAFSALLGGFIASTLFGQSLTEHAAAAAGATIGTAAGKPLGTALGRVFGEVDQTTSRAAGPKTVKPVATPPAPVATPTASPAVTEHRAATSGGGGGGDESFAGGSGASSERASSSHHLSRRRALAEEPAPVEAAPVLPVAAEPAVKEPSAEDIASVRVGATSSELRESLGAPESTVSIPGDDGHLLEIRQYWAKGEPVGTIRLDNGHVVSVQANN